MLKLLDQRSEGFYILGSNSKLPFKVAIKTPVLHVHGASWSNFLDFPIWWEQINLVLFSFAKWESHGKVFLIVCPSASLKCQFMFFLVFPIVFLLFLLCICNNPFLLPFVLYIHCKSVSMCHMTSIGLYFFSFLFSFVFKNLVML